jgi:hypothetical protein
MGPLILPGDPPRRSLSSLARQHRCTPVALLMPEQADGAGLSRLGQAVVSPKAIAVDALN